MQYKTSGQDERGLTVAWAEIVTVLNRKLRGWANYFS
jgi:hypothetical protein